MNTSILELDVIILFYCTQNKQLLFITQHTLPAMIYRLLEDMLPSTRRVIQRLFNRAAFRHASAVAPANMSRQRIKLPAAVMPPVSYIKSLDSRQFDKLAKIIVELEVSVQ